MRFWSNLFSFRGRIGGFYFFVQMQAAAVLLPIAIFAASVVHNELGVDWGWPPTIILMTAPTLLAVISGLVRRFHDFGLSGWWASVPVLCFLSPVAWLVFLMPLDRLAGSDGVALGFLLTITLSGLALNLPIWLPGRRGDNRYGPSPG